MTILDEIVAHKRLEVAEATKRCPTEMLQSRLAEIESLKTLPQALPDAGAFLNIFKPSAVAPAFILEVKPASPSAGLMKPAFSLTADLPPLLDVYGRYASAVSVLTDERYFGGSLRLLEATQKQLSCPVLRKDFIIDAYQLLEARLAGAAAVLLIVKILDNQALKSLYDQSLALGLTPVVEIQNPEEWARLKLVLPKEASQETSVVVLINNRNLSTFEVDLATTQQLSQAIRADLQTKNLQTSVQTPKIISASGIATRQDVEGLRPFCDGFLIGSALMKTPDLNALEATLRDLICPQ